jgi:hypothetical protein
VGCGVATGAHGIGVVHGIEVVHGIGAATGLVETGLLKNGSSAAFAEGSFMRALYSPVESNPF